MKITVPKQSQTGETRVPLVPRVVKQLVAMGIEVVIEAGAGKGAYHGDTDYEAAGATVTGDSGSVWSEGDVVITIHPPTAVEAGHMRKEAVLIGLLSPLANPEVMDTLAQREVTSFSLEFVPRISRAQPMDALSSQANVAGYVAVVLAASACPKMFPMMITAAGTIAPSRVFVIGAGVAGLQAIATAKRLGAVVEAYDVRPAVKEQVQSVGGRFVELPTTKQDAQTTGGYAKQQSAEERQQQVELMGKHVVGADVVITTAAVFGKAPPLLIPKDLVKKMHAGSVIVDLAADERAGRGNCEATRPGKRFTTKNGVMIEGTTNFPALASVHSSQLYANNVLAFLKEIVKDEGRLALDLDDEIQKGSLMTHQGHLVNTVVLESRKG